MEPRFIVDLNIGRLGKWLRVIGYDALFVPDVGDEELIRIALKEKRIILTKDSVLMQRRIITSGQVQAFLVTHDGYRDQLKEVVEGLSLSVNAGFSRCIECNTALEETTREVVQERVPLYVYQTQEEFMVCRKCNRIYWRGTHWRNMRQELTRVRGEMP
ncbi:MAG: Mut7-C RNAse domain-containing protein [Chloroflexi bacterium]|nr:Mut7-C RNAse domain-containing protein [Chloroflexota bacterium]